MKNRNSCLYTLLGLIVLVVLIAGCSLSERPPCPKPDVEIAQLNPGEDLVALRLQNDTCMSICLLLVSPDHCEYMEGVNWVQDHPLRSEESIMLYVPPGKYAAWVELCTEEFRADENLKAFSDFTHAIIDSATGSKPPCGTSLTIVNNTDVPICKMWIGNTDSVFTGRNWLGSEHLQPGESLMLSLRPDTYFIRAEDCEGNWMRSEVDVDISGHQTWTVP